MDRGPLGGCRGLSNFLSPGWGEVRWLPSERMGRRASERNFLPIKKHRPRQGRAGEFDTRLHPCCALMPGFRCSVAGLAHSPSPYPPRFAPLQGRACKAQPHGWQLSQARTRRPQPIRCFMSPDVPATDGRDSIRTSLLLHTQFRSPHLPFHLLWAFPLLPFTFSGSPALSAASRSARHPLPLTRFPIASASNQLPPVTPPFTAPSHKTHRPTRPTAERPTAEQAPGVCLLGRVACGRPAAVWSHPAGGVGVSVLSIPPPPPPRVGLSQHPPVFSLDPDCRVLCNGGCLSRALSVDLPRVVSSACVMRHAASLFLVPFRDEASQRLLTVCPVPPPCLCQLPTPHPICLVSHQPTGRRVLSTQPRPRSDVFVLISAVCV